MLYFLKVCLTAATLTVNFIEFHLEIAFKHFFWKKYFLKYIIQCKHIDLNEIYVK